MYKVLIADDEDIIRRGIAGFLSRDPDVQVVAQAEDGDMALELALEELPDLLFVDINMPFLNGLEFIEKLQNVLKNAVIIIITGYDDFSYAQRALRLGVFDYLLKPIMEDTFFAALNKAKEQLSRSKTQVKYLEWARKQLEKNKGNLTAEFLEDWLGGRFSDAEVAERMGFLGLDMPERFGVTVLHLYGHEDLTQPGQNWNEDLLLYAAENVAREVLEPFAPVSACKNSGGDLVVISASEPPEAWREAGERLCALLPKYLPVRVLYAQGVGKGFRALPEVYESVLENLEQTRGCSQVVLDTKGYVDVHYGETELSLQEVADHLFLSPQHISRVFRHETGITFVEYLTRVRIRKAMELLVGSDRKIYEISEYVGYSSQHYFSSAFKKILGVSPADYRKTEQGR